MTLSLPPLLAWLAATVLPLGAAWLLFRVVLRPERCFGYNRILLLLAPLVAAGLPLLTRPALPVWLAPPALKPAETVGGSVLLPALSAAGGVGNGAGPGWPWLAALYGAGVALGLGRLAWQLWRLRRATRALPREQRDGYALACTGGQLPTSSFGKTIFWDETASLTAAEAASVLAHERAHVRQGHSSDVLWLEIWRAVLWLNPFAHLLLPALRLTHELLADRAAARAGMFPSPSAPANASSYAALLARLTAHGVVGPAHSTLLQPFTLSFTLTRIAMLQNQIPVRRWKQWLALPVLGGSFLVACQPDSVQPGSPPPPKLVEPARQLKILSADQKEVMKVKVREALRNDSVRHVGQDMSGEKQTVYFMEDGTVRIVWGPKLPQRLPPGVYFYVEQMPELTTGGGYAAIVQAIQQNLVYPKAYALTAPGVGKTSVQLEGRVLVSFTVDAEGAIRDAKVIKGLSADYDAAVLTAVQKLPRFVPGRQDGRAVAVSFTVPIQFEQSKSDSQVASPPPPKLQRQ